MQFHEFQLNLFDIPPLTPTLPGVTHADELFLQWSPLVHIPLEMGYYIKIIYFISFMILKYFSPNDILTSNHILNLWSNFIKTGDPGAPWEPVTDGDNKNYLNLNTDPHMEARDDSYHERMQFWRSIWLHS